MADEEEVLRATERERLRALVAADTEAAERLHADDFQLITASGDSVLKEEYLGAVASGEIDYRVWEPAEIAVRVNGNAAVVRYTADIEIVVEGREIPRTRCWHTDTYEKRDGRWQVVWSQATAIL